MSFERYKPYLRQGLAAIFMFVLVTRAIKVSAQTNIKGCVYDTTQKKPCVLAVIAILNKDSTLILFTRSEKNGNFLLPALSQGRYNLIITHPSYSPFSLPVNIQAGQDMDLGKLYLLSKAQLLTEVLVTAKEIPPRMRGDTLEYNTAHIKTRINANLEELLARLPGVEVDQNGVITVNGNKVDKLLVNGEDFFGNDPTIVTRNFNADMIAKVQVLDRKSDKAQFTGVDDGERTKTINIVVKEERKKGYFGKLEAGANLNGYHNATGILGSFKDQRQIGIIGMASNIGTTSFNGNVGDMGSSISIDNSSIDPFGASAGRGIPNLTAAGLHYADKWNEGDQHLNGNYKYGRTIADPFTSSIVRQTLPDSIFIQRDFSKSHNFSDRHAADADYDYNIDSLSAIRLYFRGQNLEGKNTFIDSNSSSFNDTLVNTGKRKISSNIQNKNMHIGAMWRIMSAKNKGRVLSILTGLSTVDNKADGYTYSLNNFYSRANIPITANTIDQRKEFSTRSTGLIGTLNYTIPISKSALLATTYQFSYNNNSSSMATFANNNGKYDKYIDSVSNQYLSKTYTHQITTNLQINENKYNYSIGGDFTQNIYNQQNLSNSTRQTNKYLNIAPRVNAAYNINDYIGFDLHYTGSTINPTITQLQPLQNNNDPLHITIGNPNLHPGFSHGFILNFHKLKPVILNIQASYSVSTTAISLMTFTDSLGRQVSQIVNTKGSNRQALHFSINKQIDKFDIDLGFTNFNIHERSVNFVNQYISNNDNYMTGGSLYISKFSLNKYSFQITSSAAYNYSQSSINRTASIEYWTQNYNAAFSLFSLAGLEINTTLWYNWRQKLGQFDEKNTNLVWNASLEKNLLSNNLSIRMQINDLLNQNTGTYRAIAQNQTTEKTTNIIGRYWMIICTFRFTHRNR